jgi:hypothetical protein
MGDRCYACCQENCGFIRCSCTCHNEPGDWESYQAMLEDILRHRLATEDQILPADDSRRIRYFAISKEGGDTFGKTWTIRLPAAEERRLTGVFAKIKLRHELTNFLNKGGANDPDFDIALMSQEQLQDEVRKLRAGIRKHREASGHDLCWHVPELWNLLPEKVNPKPEVPPREEFLHRCALYRDSLEPAKHGIKEGDLVQHKDSKLTGRVTRFDDPAGNKMWVNHTGPYPFEELTPVSQP